MKEIWYLYKESVRKKWRKEQQRLLADKQHHVADKVCIVKAMVFPIIMYSCESQAIKKTESQRTEALEL